MSESPTYNWPRCLARLLHTSFFDDAGPGGFKRDWLSGQCACMAEFRQMLTQGDTGQLNPFLQSLTRLEPTVYEQRARMVVVDWLPPEDSDNLGSSDSVTPGGDESQRLARAIQGMAAVCLASAAQQRWLRTFKDSDLVEFAEHARTAIMCLSAANPLETHSPPIDVGVATHLPPHLRALIESARGNLLPLDDIPSSGWLAVEWLLALLSGNEPSAVFHQDTYLLLQGGKLDPRGFVASMELTALTASHAGIFLDPSIAGGLLLDDSMQASILQAHRWARDTFRATGITSPSEQLTLAIRLRPRFDLPVFRLGGGSAGVLLACGMRAALEQRPLNHDVTATACLAKGMGLELVADAVAERSILAKLQATRDRTPRITHVLMESTQAQRFRRHRDVLDLDITIHPVNTLQQAYAYMTRDAELDDVLRQHCRAIASHWDEQVNIARRNPREVEHRLDRFVWPRYEVLPRGHRPNPDLSTDSRDDELPVENQAMHQRLYEPIEEGAEEGLRLLLMTHRRLCVTEDAGAGKSVFSFRAATLTAHSDSWWQAMFGGPPLIVRIEGEWPSDRRQRPVSLESMLRAYLRDHLTEVQERHGRSRTDLARCKEVVRHALANGRVLLILDAWDQFSPQQRHYISDHVLQAQGPAERCRVVVTSREFAVHDNIQTLFRPHRWRFARLAGFTPGQQAEYFHDLAGIWQRVVPHHGSQQDLLRIPDVLSMIRHVIEDCDDQSEVPVFTTRGQLYLEASQRLLARALLKQKAVFATESPFARLSRAEALKLLRHVIGLLAFRMCLANRFNYRIPGLGDDAHTLDDFLEQAFQQFAQVAPKSQTTTVTQEVWRGALQVLHATEFSHRVALDIWTNTMPSFRSRRTMEWYAAHYLVNHATDSDLADAAQYASNPQWYWVWRFVLEMPRTSYTGEKARECRRMARALALLFRPIATSPPSELMYRCWHLFEVEHDPHVGDEFPYERDDRGRIQLLPGGSEVVHDWRWSFWQRFAASDERTQSEALYLIPEDLLWVALQASEGSTDDSATMAACQSLGLDSQRLLQLGKWLAPHRAEILRRWRETRQRCWPGDPWPNIAFHPWRAYQDCAPSPPHQPQRAEFPNANASSEEFEVLLGASSHDLHAFPEERPQRRVRLVPFQLQTFCVTVSQFQLLAPRRAATTPDRPAVHVTWFDAWLFCKVLGPAFRLPTDAEYEFAHRGGSSAVFWWNTYVIDHQRCNHSDSGLNRPLTRTESLQECDRYANFFGLLHMTGNVLQWIHDPSIRFSAAITAAGDALTERDPADGRVCRGSSYLSPGRFCRATFRSFQAARTLNNVIGFRVCRTIDRHKCGSHE